MAASDDVAPPELGEEPGSEDALLLALLLRGALSIEELAVASGVSSNDAERDVERLRAEGLLGVEPRPLGEALALTASGRERASAVLAREADTLRPWLEPRYGAFMALDRRVKQALHRWQVRTDLGADRPNDHRDRRYDALVLAELRAVHAEADAWLAPLAAARRRYASLRARLAGALERAARGDVRAVAGVVGDSFHLAWWQLHADLLRILDRERGPEDA
ncbi:MAG TPA: hypothetical protein VIS07_18980 [Candidatus Binatia bacterium]